MNWLITGGCGFIGTRLVQHLLERDGAGIRIVDDLSVGTEHDLGTVARFDRVVPNAIHGAPDGVELLVGDVREAELALTACRGIDAIVHLAANTGVQPSLDNPRRDCTVNVLGTLNYLEAAREHGIRRFVLASSGGTVIGDAEPPIHEELVPHPRSPYGASKSAGEGYCSAYAASFGVDAVALRFGNVYGPGSTHKNSVVARFVKRAMNGDELEIYGDGEQTRDFIYIDDLIRAIVRAAVVDGIGGQVFQVATGRETSVRQLAAIVTTALERMGFSKPQVLDAPPLRGEIRRNASDVSKAGTWLDWRPQTSLEDGVLGTVRWFMEERTRSNDPHGS